MNKTTPLITAILGAILLVAQQYAGTGPIDLLVVGMAVLIAVLGVVGTFLQGKGASFLGALGATVLTFINVYQGGAFTWNEFILTAVIAIITTVAPSLIPKPVTKED